jgi:hypothetical protein
VDAERNEYDDPELIENAGLIQSFKFTCLGKGINLENRNFAFHHTIGIVASFPNIANILCPNLQPDKEGLHNFKSLLSEFNVKPRISGFLYSEDFMLMAHPYLRRSMDSANSFTPAFINLFWSVDFKNIDAYIALDLDRVRINLDGVFYAEKDYWFGPRFGSEISAIKDDISQLRPPADLIDRHISYCFADVYSLNFKWETKGDVKSFQCKEFKLESITLELNGIIYHPVRYLHAEYDLNKKEFRHLDGAIQFYTDEEYNVCRDSDFNHNQKNSNHVKAKSFKLFKLNGSIPEEMWREFVAAFLPSNPLILEYFEGKYPQPVTNLLNRIRESRSPTDV